MPEYKIEVHLTSDHENEVHYHFVIFQWSPPMEDEEGFWYNSGMNGYEDTPEKAFAEGMRQYRKYVK
jgi:hypothetical protein